MNDRELKTALEGLNRKVEEVIAGLSGSDQPRGDASRCDYLEVIVMDIAIMRRHLEEGQWEGRSIEGYSMTIDGGAIVGESPKTG